MKLRSVLIALPLLALIAAGCDSSSEKDAKPADDHAGHNHAPGEGHENETPKAADAKPAADVKVQITDVKEGKGPGAANGDLLLMEYTGTLTNGTEFDSNDRSKKPDATPFSFVLGEGSVIQGWDQGLVGMKVGGERDLHIPYQLAYGEQGSGQTIPPKSDLKFKVKLLDMVKKGEEAIFDKDELKKGTGPAVKEGSKISIHYVGTLVNGAQFDSSVERGQPLEVEVGKTRLIPGFTAGLVGMRQGGKYRLRLPPLVAYGPGGSPPRIPPNSVLIFEIEVLKVQ